MNDTPHKTPQDEQETETVFQLIYASAATRELEPAELEKILAAARRNNQPAGITGMLVYHEGSFLQVLEGDRELVEALYEKIELDDRHTNAFILLRSEDAERCFERWSMGFSRPTEDQKREIPGLNDFLRVGFTKPAPGQETELESRGQTARKILLAFREGRWHRSVDGA